MSRPTSPGTGRRTYPLHVVARPARLKRLSGVVAINRDFSYRERTRRTRRPAAVQWNWRPVCGHVWLRYINLREGGRIDSPSRTSCLLKPAGSVRWRTQSRVIEQTMAMTRRNFQWRSLAASANGCVPRIVVPGAAIAERCDEAGPWCKRRGQRRCQFSSGARACGRGNLISRPEHPVGRRLSYCGGLRSSMASVQRLFGLADFSDWLLEWHVGIALMVLPGDCAAAPGWCSANPRAWCVCSECATILTRAKNPAAPKGEALGRIGRGGARYRRQVAAPSSWRGVSFCASGNMRPRQDGGLCVNEHNECSPYRPADPGPPFEVAHGSRAMCAGVHTGSLFVFILPAIMRGVQCRQ
jgi:hypothetical protein